MLNGTSELDKSMDMELKKYVDSVLMCVKYMGGKNDAVCIAQRKSKVKSYLFKFGQD